MAHFLWCKRLSPFLQPSIICAIYVYLQVLWWPNSTFQHFRESSERDEVLHLTELEAVFDRAHGPPQALILKIHVTVKTPSPKPNPAGSRDGKMWALGCLLLQGPVGSGCVIFVWGARPRFDYYWRHTQGPDLQASNLGALFQEILDGLSGMPRNLVKLSAVGQDHVPGRECLNGKLRKKTSQ